MRHVGQDVELQRCKKAIHLPSCRGAMVVSQVPQAFQQLRALVSSSSSNRSNRLLHVLEHLPVATVATVTGNLSLTDDG